MPSKGEIVLESILFVIAIPYVLPCALLLFIVHRSFAHFKWMVWDGPKSMITNYRGSQYGQYLMGIALIAIPANLMVLGWVGRSVILSGDFSQTIEHAWIPSAWNNVTIDNVNDGWRWSFGDTMHDLEVVKICDATSRIVSVLSGGVTVATARYSVNSDNLHASVKNWWVNTSSGISLMGANTWTLPSIPVMATMLVLRDDAVIAYSTDVAEPYHIRSFETHETVLTVANNMQSMISEDINILQPIDAILFAIPTIFGDGTDSCSRSLLIYVAVACVGSSLTVVFTLCLHILDEDRRNRMMKRPAPLLSEFQEC